MDFVTGLPVSKGNTVVLTVVDRFSKIVHFIALPKLSIVLETAKLMIDNIFKYHGIPEDVVSDGTISFCCHCAFRMTLPVV